MTGTFADIQTLANNLKTKGYELVNVQDPARKQAKHPAGGGSSGSENQDDMWAWKEAHGDAAGGIEVTILPLHGAGPKSPFLDPGSVNGDSGEMVAWMKKHPSAA